MLRTSDLIARLDDGRLVAVLPGASAENALRVAGTVKEMVAARGEATHYTPLIITRVDRRRDISRPRARPQASLRAVAAAALADARAQGPNHLASASEHDPEETVVLQLADISG